MGRLAALGLIIDGGPLCGPFPIFSKHPEFGEFVLPLQNEEGGNETMVTYLSYNRNSSISWDEIINRCSINEFSKREFTASF